MTSFFSFSKTRFWSRKKAPKFVHRILTLSLKNKQISIGWAPKKKIEHNLGFYTPGWNFTGILREMTKIRQFQKPYKKARKRVRNIIAMLERSYFGSRKKSCFSHADATFFEFKSKKSANFWKVYFIRTERIEPLCPKLQNLAQKSQNFAQKATCYRWKNSWTWSESDGVLIFTRQGLKAAHLAVFLSDIKLITIFTPLSRLKSKTYGHQE